MFGFEKERETLVDALLVVVEAEGRRAGLLVDDLLGQQQVVIKSLETNFRQIEGISGATILGDGTIALIVDVPGLVTGYFQPAALDVVESLITKCRVHGIAVYEGATSKVRSSIVSEVKADGVGYGDGIMINTKHAKAEVVEIPISEREQRRLVDADIDERCLQDFKHGCPGSEGSSVFPKSNDLCPIQSLQASLRGDGQRRGSIVEGEHEADVFRGQHIVEMLLNRLREVAQVGIGHIRSHRNGHAVQPFLKPQQRGCCR